MTTELANLRQRLDAAYARLRETPATGPGVYGAPDPESGERWNAGNVLGHVAELLPFWVDQVRGVLAGRELIGRGGPRPYRTTPGRAGRAPPLQNDPRPGGAGPAPTEQRVVVFRPRGSWSPSRVWAS